MARARRYQPIEIMTGSVASAAKVNRTKPRGGITDFDLSQVGACIISESEINRTYRGRIRAVDYRQHLRGILDLPKNRTDPLARSEEHTSELQSLMRHSYAVFCLKKKKTVERK